MAAGGQQNPCCDDRLNPPTVPRPRRAGEPSRDTAGQVRSRGRTVGSDVWSGSVKRVAAAVGEGVSFSFEPRPRHLLGCRRELCRNSSGAISGMNIVLDQATRSIVSFVTDAGESVFQPSTLRMVI
jgi:hypothetical protein